MKRIYATAAVLLALFTGSAQAQDLVDLEAVVIMDPNTGIPATGQGISYLSVINGQAPTNDSIAAATLAGVTGNGLGMVQGNQFFFVDPTCALAPSGGVFGYAPQLNQDIDTGQLFFVDRNLTASDSITLLLNVAVFESDTATMWSSLVVPRANFVQGQTYGFFSYVTEWPQTGADYVDTLRGNNWAYVPIVWDVNTSLKDMLNRKYASMDIYPNPATDNVSFEINNLKTTKATTVRVMSVTGRVVKTENYGAAPVGNQKYSMNLSDLAAGQYSIQVITDNEIYMQKFIKK